ncbi:MAG: hypothetical protein JWO63_3447, partial [Frankiales bacterium]|nr:hypothetical protein [Frankiales bacterium]
MTSAAYKLHPNNRDFAWQDAGGELRRLTP